MLPLNHKRTASSLAPPIICVAKKIGNKKIEGSPLEENIDNRWPPLTVEDKKRKESNKPIILYSHNLWAVSIFAKKMFAILFLSEDGWPHFHL